MDAELGAADPALRAFIEAAGGSWRARYDRRTGTPALVWGSGRPWLPGRGNDLTWEGLGFAGEPSAEVVGELLEARARRAEGRYVDAVHLTLDVMAMGAACVQDGVLINQMVGAALVSIAVDAWPDEALRAAGAEALQTLRDGLARIDARLPATLDLDAELREMADALLSVPDQQDWCGVGSWRYGFSTRWMNCFRRVYLSSPSWMTAPPPCATRPIALSSRTDVPSRFVAARSSMILRLSCR